MPSLGADMTEGTLLEWLVKPGDVVHRGDIVAVVDTAKSAIDVEVFQDGLVARLLVEPGTVVPVGEPLALLDEQGEGTTEEGIAGPSAPTAAAPAPAPADAAPAPAPAPAGPGGPRIAASPFARRRAAELGIDLATVAGHGGVVSVDDVERAAASAPPTPAPPTSAPSTTKPSTTKPSTTKPSTTKPSTTKPAELDRAAHAAAMREAIAALMARSKKEIPHYYLTWDLDLGAALAWLAGRNAARAVDERIVPAALLLKAVAVAASQFPEMNGLYVDGVYHPAERVNVGVAVALRGAGLIAPALGDAQELDLDTLMSRMKDLVTRARGGRLRSSEMSDATITVTNLGEQGAQSVHGVIYPPQVALVGFGRIEERPVAVNGLLGVRPMTTATLAADHRVSDGHRGGLFLARIGELLDDPAAL